VNYIESLSNLPLDGDFMANNGNPEIYIKRMKYFLELLGRPDQGFKYIHITGTSGKGSVTNMIHCCLNASGKKVGSFVSPSVVTTIDKILVNDKFMSPDDFADIVEWIKPALDESYARGPYGRPSYFEIIFAISLLYFKKMKCEWVVLEVGLGGRFDATNVINNPVVTGITNIGYDHTEILGNTLPLIANDKAGIIKRGSEFFTTESRPDLLSIFDGICKKYKVTMRSINTGSDYRINNIALVKSICQFIGLTKKNITTGIKRSKLMCRFEMIQKNPIVILDGAHNESKVATTLYNLNKLHFDKLFLIIGISENKDHYSILRQVIPAADIILFTRFENRDRKCAHPTKLFAKSKEFMKTGAQSNIYLDPKMALAWARKKASKNDAILVVGSFFLAGELREVWIPEDVVLRSRKAHL
jgi:dihydrofolate synthase/folylpolyglutamate synthase